MVLCRLFNFEVMVNEIGIAPQTRAFIPADHLELWLKNGEISFSSYPLETVATFAEKGVSFNIIPAYWFLKLEDGQEDPEGLIGTVKTRQELDRLNPDIFMDTILVGENAYKVEIGYALDARNHNGKPPPPNNRMTCSGCLYLVLRADSRSRVYRCSRFRRVIFAAYSDSLKDDDGMLHPLSDGCHVDLEDDRWYLFSNPAGKSSKAQPSF